MTDFGIVVPACNEQDYIGTTLQDLINQSGDGPDTIARYDCEIVVVESNSTDRTADVVADIVNHSPAMVTLIHGGTATMTGARVLGIEHLLAKPNPPRYLVSADADTRYPRGWLAALGKELGRGVDVVTCAGYMDANLWQRCPRLTQRYLDEVGTLFFDPDTRAVLGERSSSGPFTAEVYADFGRPMCEAGFAITATCYRALGGFQPGLVASNFDQRLLPERFPLTFGAALNGYHVAQLAEPWWSTSPRRLVGEPEIQFGQQFVHTEMRQHRRISEDAYIRLDESAGQIDFHDLRFNCVLDYIVLPCVTRPHLVRRHRTYFGDDWRSVASAIHRFLADHPAPEPRQIVDFAVDLAGQCVDGILDRLYAAGRQLKSDVEAR